MPLHCNRRRTVPHSSPWLSSCLAAFVILLFGCRNDPNKIRLLTGSGIHEDKAIGITAIYSKRGNIKSRLFAREYVQHPGVKPTYSELNGNLRIEFYNDSGNLEQILTADSCRVYEVEQNAIVWGNVKILGSKGDQLYTEELIWNQSIGKFFTEKYVKIVTSANVVEGNGLEANQDFTWYRITHPSGQVQVQKGEVPQ